jgi:spore maturation protein CgeB
MYPDILSKSFAEQYEHFIYDSCDTVSSISKSFRDIGVDAHEIFTNVKGLQNQWAVENNCSKSGPELVLEQLKKFQPDVVWLDDTKLIDAKWIAAARETVRSIKIITAEICAPYTAENLRHLRAIDFLVTCTPCLKREFEQAGIATHLVYHAFDPQILNKISHDNHYPSVDLLFTGSLYTGGGFHKTRIEYLEKFLRADLPVQIFGHVDSNAKILSKMTAYYAINSLRAFGAKKFVKHIPYLKNYESFGDTPVQFYSRKLTSSIFNPVYGLEQFKLLSKARICFNIHGEVAGGCAGNLRLFEATGIGTCLVTDWKENLGDLFEPEKEVVTYKSREECIDKISWLLKNPAEVAKISAAGQARTQRDHTFHQRAILIDEIINAKIRGTMYAR